MSADHLPPPRHLLLREALSVFSRCWRGIGRLGERGPEDGTPLMVIPGFFASDRTTLGLQRGLAKAGYRVTGWGMGLNRGVTPHTLDDIVARLEAFARGRKAILVGWSLGGVFAREVAKRRSRRGGSPARRSRPRPPPRVPSRGPPPGSTPRRR